MNDAGLHHILRTILDAKTKTKAKAILDTTGDDYLAIARELVERLTFKRTKNQNSLYYEWISEIAKQTHSSELEIRRFVKYQFGLPILFRNMPEQARICKERLGNATFDDKLKLMDLFAVSSLMKTKEMSEYMDQIELHYQAQGIRLSQPKEAA